MNRTSSLFWIIESNKIKHENDIDEATYISNL